MFKSERTKYLTAMRKADHGEYGPLGELIARAVTNNLYRFVVPAVAGPARLVPLASLIDPRKGITATSLRAAAERGRLRAQKSDNGTWLSSRNWVEEYQRNKHRRVKGSTSKRSEGCAAPGRAPSYYNTDVSVGCFSTATGRIEP